MNTLNSRPKKQSSNALFAKVAKVTNAAEKKIGEQPNDLKMVIAVLGLLMPYVLALTFLVAKKTRLALIAVVIVLLHAFSMLFWINSMTTISGFFALSIFVFSFALTILWVFGVVNLIKVIIPNFKKQKLIDDEPEDLSHLIYNHDLAMTEKREAEDTPLPMPDFSQFDESLRNERGDTAILDKVPSPTAVDDTQEWTPPEGHFIPVRGSAFGDTHELGSDDPELDTLEHEAGSSQWESNANEFLEEFENENKQ